MKKTVLLSLLLTPFLSIQACGARVKYSKYPDFSLPKISTNCAEVSLEKALSFLENDSKETTTNWGDSLIFDYYYQLPKELTSYYAEHPYFSSYLKCGMIATSRTIINKEHKWARSYCRLNNGKKTKASKDLGYRDHILIYDKIDSTDDSFVVKIYRYNKIRYCERQVDHLFSSDSTLEYAIRFATHCNLPYDRSFCSVFFPGLEGVFLSQVGLNSEQASQLLLTENNDKYFVQNRIVKMNDSGELFIQIDSNGMDEQSKKYISSTIFHFKDYLPLYYEQSISFEDYQFPVVIKKKWHMQDTTPAYYPNDYYYSYEAC